jgi:hypothetical protein
MQQIKKIGNRRQRPLGEESGDYYDDSDDEKGHAASSDKLYGSACSLDKFFLNPCLCLWVTLRLSCQRRYVAKVQKRLKPMHAVLLLLLVLLVRYVLRYNAMQPHPLRPRSDSQVDKLRIVIPSLASSKHADLGGWYSSVPFRRPGRSMQMKPDRVVDFGGLIFKSLTPGRFHRVSDPEDYDKYEDIRLREMNRMDMDPTLKKYDHDDEQDYTKCRRPNWKSSYYPNCNAFHEIGMERIYDPTVTSLIDKTFDSYLFSHGYYRDAWLLDNMEKHEGAVLKTLRMKHDFTPRIFANVQRDAVIMERMTSSRYIVNIFGHCAASLSVEPVAFEIEEYIVVSLIWTRCDCAEIGFVVVTIACMAHTRCSSLAMDTFSRRNSTTRTTCIH